ncbi:DUF4276 family protein [Winogradskyella haliclonae]|uniref:DUF4276 family protein n=1 Tax=Winogradskyella haliclonae TaxID=2048558 RepID=A0ABQ2C1Z8_9FLAO|nr:DUF4276 family protein [Winogradskyella haliclonae]GGI58072.1 hypothetical protein GCM10011444_23810 [Winogradskyella haliclonae]
MSKSKKTKIKAIGLIVEDNSDFTSLKIIISRIIKKNNLTFKKAIGNGCGKMKRKAVSYANVLSNKGCDLIILVHDLDRNDLKTLRTELNQTINMSNAKNKFVCIPIEEIEGWFLSDPEGIKNAFGLKRIPNIKGNPETVTSPKEKLEDFVFQCSNKSKIYLNTKHNNLLSASLDLEKIRKKCVSFKEFEEKINTYSY